MKHNQLMKVLRKAGCKFHHHGTNHDVWENPATGALTSVPRHGSKEIKTKTLETILKELGI